MSIKVTESGGGSAFVLRAEGTLTREDYRKMEARLDVALRMHSLPDLLVDLREFEGMTPGAMWEELKFDAEHLSDVNRIAVLGDKRWQEWATKLVRPFTSAKVQYFATDQEEKARRFVGATTQP